MFLVRGKLWDMSRNSVDRFYESVEGLRESLRQAFQRSSHECIQVKPAETRRRHLPVDSAPPPVQIMG